MIIAWDDFKLLNIPILILNFLICYEKYNIFWQNCNRKNERFEDRFDTFAMRQLGGINCFQESKSKDKFPREGV